MTGMGHAEDACPSAFISVTLKSINHRHLEIKTRMPKELLSLESKICAVIAQHCLRGHIDVDVKFESKAELPEQSLDETKLHETLNAINHWQHKFPHLNIAISWSDMVTISQKKNILSDGVSDQALTLLWRVLTDACQDLSKARAEEGRQLAMVVHDMLGCVNECLKFIRDHMDSDVTERYQALKDRSRQLFSDVAISDDRLYQELAILCERMDYKEEIDRLYAHASHFGVIITEAKAKGRKLDFLCQEMLRESTTLLSKGQNQEVLIKGIELKALIERIREQVQNIE